MPRVEFAGAPLIAPSYSDTFQNGNTLFQNWITGAGGGIPITNPIWTCTFSIGALTLGGTGLLVGALGNGAELSQYPAFCIPPILQKRVQGKSQFAEMQLSDFTSGPSLLFAGPAVRISRENISSGNISFYGLMVNAGNNWNLVKWGSTGASYETKATGGAASVANGDILRLESRIIAGNNELKVFKNGVLQTTFSDAVNVFANGLPGICASPFSQAAGGDKSEWNTFNGGLVS